MAAARYWDGISLGRGPSINARVPAHLDAPLGGALRPDRFRAGGPGDAASHIGIGCGPFLSFWGASPAGPGAGVGGAAGALFGGAAREGGGVPGPLGFGGGGGWGAAVPCGVAQEQLACCRSATSRPGTSEAFVWQRGVGLVAPLQVNVTFHSGAWGGGGGGGEGGGGGGAGASSPAGRASVFVPPKISATEVGERGTEKGKGGGERSGQVFI